MTKNLDKYGATMQGFFDKSDTTMLRCGILRTETGQVWGNGAGFFDKNGATVRHSFLTRMLLDNEILDRYGA